MHHPMFPFLRNHDGDVREVVRGLRFPFLCQFFILELFLITKMVMKLRKKLFVVEKYFPLKIPIIKLISLNYDKK